MKTAVIYNPNAGKGIPAAQVLARLSSFFEGDELLVADPALCCDGVPVRLVEHSTEDTSYLGLFHARVRALTEAGAQRFACVGGDGTSTYLCNALYSMGLSLPILGVAAGTANVGPVVSVTLDDLEGRTVAQSREVCYSGVGVYQNGKFISLGFNDIIIGDTFLATVDGQSCNVSVRELLLNGAIVPQRPSEDILKDTFCIHLNGRALKPASGNIQQIIISSVAHESHYGRAVYGPICKCDWGDKKGVISMCDHIAVTFEETDAGTERISTMQYLLFGPQDDVALSGFSPKACLVCDGNPYLLETDRITLEYKSDLVRTITL